MANLVVDPSFENNSPAWVFEREAERKTNGAHTGVWYAEVRSETGFLGSKDGEVYQLGLPLIVGEEYTVGFYYKLPGFQAETHILEVWIDEGDGFTNRLTLVSDDAEPDWTLVSFTFEAVGPVGAIRFYARGTSEFVVANVEWWLDDIFVGTGDMITHTLRSALIADLEDIDPANGFTTKVEEVSMEAIRYDEICPIHIAVESMEGESDEITFDCEAEDQQSFGLGMFVRSANNRRDMDDLLDDVRNAVQRKTSNLKTTDVVIVRKIAMNWEDTLTDPVTEDGTLYRTAVVTVFYDHRVGEA